MEEITGKGGFVRQILKGTAAAIIVTLTCVLVFAFVLSVSGMSETFVKPVNQFIKLISVFSGCVFAVKGEKGFIKGGVIGLLATALAALLFGIIAGGISSPLALAIDVVCGVLMGAISGAISVNLPSRS